MPEICPQCRCTASTYGCFIKDKRRSICRCIGRAVGVPCRYKPETSDKDRSVLLVLATTSVTPILQRNHWPTAQLIAGLINDLANAEALIDELRCKECDVRFDDDGQCDCLMVQDCCDQPPELCRCENPTPTFECLPGCKCSRCIEEMDRLGFEHH